MRPIRLGRSYPTGLWEFGVTKELRIVTFESPFFEVVHTGESKVFKWLLGPEANFLLRQRSPFRLRLGMEVSLWQAAFMPNEPPSRRRLCCNRHQSVPNHTQSAVG